MGGRDRATTVVGRDEELAALDRRITSAKEGRGGAVLVHGEPGIGKSTLARAFGEHAARAGLAVCWGRAWEAGGAPPYWPWIEVLREALAIVDDDVLATARGIGPIVELVPEIGERVPGIDAGPAVDAARARFRLFDATLRFLRQVSTRRPLAIVLDDLHAADVPTLSLLTFVVAALHQSRVVLVGTFRAVEARLAEEAGALLLKAERDADESLALGRLGQAAVADLVSAHAGRPAAAKLVERLYRATEGNPLFVVETLRLMGSSDVATDSAGLPRGVNGVLRQRLARLPDETRALLETGAAMGREVDVPLLCLATAMSAELVAERLRPAELVDVLAPRGEDRWTFTHVLLRDALYAGIPPARRAGIHLAIAEALAQRHSADERTRAMGLAHHYLEAAPVAGIERALHHAERAAERALELHAHEEAISLLDRVLRALDLAGDDGARRLDVLLVLGRTCIRAGETTRGREACARAAAIARERRDADGLARAALAAGEIITFAKVDPVLIALLREALAAIGDVETPMRACLLGRLAAALQPAPDPIPPMAMAREAIAIAHRVGDSATRLAVLTSAGSALLYFAEPAERIAVNLELVEIASVRGDRVRAARGHLRLVFDHLELGDVASADAHAAQYESIARALALPAYLWNVSMLASMRATIAGSFDEAARLHDEARALAERTDDPNARFTLAIQGFLRMLASTRTDGIDDAEKTFVDALVTATDFHYRRACLAMVHARRGRDDQARAALDEVRDQLDEWSDRQSAAWLGEACARVGDEVCAERLLAILRAFSSRIHVCGLASMTCDLPIVAVIGMLEERLGRIDDAIARYGEAHGRAVAMGATPMRATIGVWLARALRRRGGEGDAERAEQSMEEAARIGVALEMPGLLAEIRAITASSADHATRRARDAASRDGATTPQVVAGPLHLEMELSGDFWCVRSGGREVRLKDSRGLRILDRLVREPGRNIHALELLGAGGEADGGDAGEALDEAAIREYRARVATLRDAIDEAEELGRGERAAELREEMDAIAHELSAGLGLGGRARRVASGAERARINVRRRVVEAMQRIADELPELGKHLGRTVKTGVFCSYHPEGPPTVTDRKPTRARSSS